MSAITERDVRRAYDDVQKNISDLSAATDNRLRGIEIILKLIAQRLTPPITADEACKAAKEQLSVTYFESGRTQVNPDYRLPAEFEDAIRRVLV
jgi:pyrimidine operon attenuation protein/uracil phosphoribosyltransferase